MVPQYFLNMISPATIVMGALFLIFFALLTYILSKVFRDKYGNVSTATVAIISFCISVLIVYFGRETIYNIINGLRLSNTILYVLSGVAVLILLYLLRKRLRFCMILMLAGAGLILIGALTDWFYQKWFVIILGIVLLFFGIVGCSKRKTNKMNDILSQALKPHERGRLPPESTRTQRQTRQKSSRELQRKHNYYSREIKNIQRNNKGKIPRRGTSDGNLRHRDLQAMKAIENIARKQGTRLR